MIGIGHNFLVTHHDARKTELNSEPSLRSKVRTKHKALWVELKMPTSATANDFSSWLIALAAIRTIEASYTD